MKPFVLIVAFLASISTGGQAVHPTGEFPLSVSILQLIATPEKFDGKSIRVVGFLRVELEGDALYLHKEDYDHHIYKNSLWVDLDPTTREDAVGLNMQYVYLIGTFDARNKGHRSMMSGSLHQIKGLMAWPPEHGKE